MIPNHEESGLSSENKALLDRIKVNFMRRYPCLYKGRPFSASNAFNTPPDRHDQSQNRRKFHTPHGKRDLESDSHAECNDYELKPHLKQEISDEGWLLIQQINNKNQNNQRVNQKQTSIEKQFWYMFAGSVVITFIPYAQLPWQFLATLFHELSHGIAALLVGGQINSIYVGIYGGLIITRDLTSASGIVAWSGYAGAVFWGLLIYWVGLRGKTTWCFVLVLSLILLIALSTVSWVNNINTIGSLLMPYSILTCALVLLKFPGLTIGISEFIRFLGIKMIVESLFHPFYLLQTQNLGDAGILFEETRIVDVFWIYQWVVIAMIGLWVAWLMTSSPKVALRTNHSNRGSTIPLAAVC